jgi:hypothetical protein
MIFGKDSGDTGARQLRHALVLASVTMASSCSTPLRPTGATIPNSAMWARMALITEVCWRMKSWRVRCSIRQLCWSSVLVSTNRILALVTASLALTVPVEEPSTASLADLRPLFEHVWFTPLGGRTSDKGSLVLGDEL